MAHIELDLRERRAIEDMLNAKVPVSKIAAEIGRHRSTVYREIKRNYFNDEELPYLNGYYGINAQTYASDRRATGATVPLHLDNIFVERHWRSLKYECVYLHAWETGSEAKAGVAKWIEFYNRKRPHSALGGKPPAVVYWLRKDKTQPDQQEKRVA